MKNDHKKSQKKEFKDPNRDSQKNGVPPSAPTCPPSIVNRIIW